MTNAHQNLLRHYLLGQLPEAEQEALETQCFAEAERLEEVWAVENQLIDDYVRERLPHGERQQFEQHYLASPRQRERVAVARLLIETADAAASSSVVVEKEPSGWTQFWAALRGPQLAWGMALATVLLLAGGAWFLAERARWREQMAAAQTTQQQRERDLAVQLADARMRNAQLAAALAELERLRQADTITAKEAQPLIPSFLLTANLLRGSSAPQPLTIPRAAKQIALRMRMETQDYAAYQAQLRTVEGADVWRRQNIKATGLRVALTVPAAQLPPGDYILTLSGISAAGAVEDGNRYFFRVRGK